MGSEDETQDGSLISVIIPCYNAGKYIAEAIRSVLAQNHSPLEIIVIDDGSTDNSSEVISNFGEPVHYTYQQNAGISAARNTGLEQARGSTIAFLDADDLWTDGKLDRQRRVLEEDPSLGLVSGYAVQFVSPELPDILQKQIKYDPKPMPAQVAGAILVRRKVIKRVGVFSTAFTAGETIDWIMRINEAGIKTKMINDVVLKRRIHTTNIGIIDPDARSDYLKVAKAALDRRRKMADDMIREEE
ncbi:MAG: glycosyltransferase family 2 protein [Candidatus Eisenbacteria bacterium]|uniref:Glycosyltransferase family 2 protein n=1 Tax=Eiseniibacteriota bacterium TaxID=2212470 RepID=A0A948RZX6_UNCEI|nr:glycosyltransferase family 2 protein [Candidatus Eisenbacteria bacterium]